MLTITIPKQELFNEANETFITLGAVVLELEHSLSSLSKWESKFQKPFLIAGDKTPEEIVGYIKAMLITQNVSDEVLQRLTEENMEAINEYIDSKESATTFPKSPKGKRPSREIITAELIYYWMVTYNIPFECQYWHLNRLFTLIQVCNIKNSKPKNRSAKEIAEENRALNEQRRAQYGTKG